MPIVCKAIHSVSVIVLAKNESKGLAHTLQQLRDFSEVVVVDSSSTDGTQDIARDCGARVVDFAWDGKYPKKKQWSLDNVQLRNDWVLLLDADEYPSAELIEEIRLLEPHLNQVTAGAFDIGLSYRFAGRFLRHGHQVTKRSLINRRLTRFPEVDDLSAPGIREVEGHYQPQTKLPINRLKGRLIHDDKDPLSSWFERHNRYSDWEAHLRSNSALRRNVAHQRSRQGRLFDLIPAKPLVFFAYSYILRAGFLDGRAGFDYAVALSAYYWQIELKLRELNRAAPTEAPTG